MAWVLRSASLALSQAAPLHQSARSMRSNPVHTQLTFPGVTRPSLHHRTKKLLTLPFVKRARIVMRRGWSSRLDLPSQIASPSSAFRANRAGNIRCDRLVRKTTVSDFVTEQIA